MSLQIKYRFKTLDDVIGNKGVVSSLKSVFDREKKEIPHAFLFHGPKGCGKTSMARILAEVLECDSSSVME
jgi:DNA polymerase-3 subunit gamma/tau